MRRVRARASTIVATDAAVSRASATWLETFMVNPCNPNPAAPGVRRTGANRPPDQAYVLLRKDFIRIFVAVGSAYP